MTGKRQCWLLLTVSFFLFCGYGRGTAELARQEAEWGLCEEAATVTGRVLRIAEKEYRRELLLEDIVLSVPGSKKTLRPRQLLVYLPTALPVREGDRIQVSGTLRTFGRATNPGQFDYRAYQASLGIYLLMEAESGEIIVPGERKLDGWLGDIKRSAAKLFMQVGGENGGTMAALVLGDKTGLSDERSQLWMDSGIGHVLSLSGLHLSLIGVGLLGLLRKRLTMPFWPSACLMITGIWLYVRLIGQGISAQRAAIALTVSLVGGCMGKTYDSLSAAALGMLIILWTYPLQVARPTFWLSFGAVFAMGGVLPAMNRWLNPERKQTKALLVPLTIQLTMMPVMAVNQYTLQTYSVLLNLIVVPLTGPLLLGSVAVLGAGLVCPKLGMLIGGLVNLAIQVIDWCCNVSLNLPGSGILTGSPAIWRLVLYGAVLSGFLYRIWRQSRLDWEKAEREEYKEQETSAENRRRGRRGNSRREVSKRWRQLILLTVILTLVLTVKIGGRQLSLTFLDVGQGDCIVIETPNGTTIMVDCGSSSEKNIFEYRLKPYFRWAGIKQLDYLVLTHLDKDHMSGAEELLAAGFPVETVLISAAATEWDKVEELSDILGKSGAKMVEISENMEIKCGEVEIRCIYPPKTEAVSSENQASVVLRLSYGRFSCLLTGDLEGDGEKQVTEELRKYPDITVLKAAHHGSRNSTSEEFLTVTRPRAAVISCGEHNSYGHPHSEVLERLGGIDCAVYCTPDCGAVQIRTDGKRWRIWGYLS